MSGLLALCFDVDASPSITLKDYPHPTRGADFPFGWGFGWYPGSELAAVAIKDPTSTHDDPMTHLLRDWQRFRSTLFVCHLRGAAERVTQRDAQPFIKSYAGRDWLFAHSGDLEGGYRDAFALPADTPFEPIGSTDSEHIFCWMLAELRVRKLRSLAAFGGDALLGWFRAFNEFGAINALLTDGEDLVVYRDLESAAGVYWIRRTPPHATTRLESHSFILEFDNSRDLQRSEVAVSSTPLSGEAWTEMTPGQLLIARRGVVTWSSVPAASTRSPALARTPQRVLESRILKVVHETTYEYSEAVAQSSHRFRLRPVQDRRQELLEYELHASVDGLQRNYEDVFGNTTTSLEVSEPFEKLVVRTFSRVLVHPEDPLFWKSPVVRDTIPLVWMPWQRQMMWPYLLPDELPESQLRELSAFAMSFVERNDYDLLETLLDMNETIYRDFEYVAGSTHIATTAFDVHQTRRGVCQDFANLLICMARLLSVPARYRMGYIFTGGNYENRVQSDASHAWVELYLPWLGWHGLDPTNGYQVNLDHVRVACGRTFVDATPTSGVLYKGGGREVLHISVSVEAAD